MLSPFKIIMLLFFATVFVNNTVYSQTDTLLVAGGARIQSVEKLDKSYDSLQKVYSPRKAIIRSAILPGYGQYTNKKYWKIPIIYGALGTTGYLFFRNLSQYKEARMAYRLASDTIASNDVLIPEPYYSVRSQPQRIATFRNQVRQNVDYSVFTPFKSAAATSLPYNLRDERISNREWEIVELLCRGMTNKQIATSLFISETTVKTHVSNILAKLDLHDRMQIIVRYYGKFDKSKQSESGTPTT